MNKTARGEFLNHHLPFAGRAAFADASALIERFGEFADSEAELRAARSRELGNVVHFCRWREVARMIEVLRNEVATGAVH